MSRKFLPADNPLRAWPRRILHSTRSRPDVKIIQLERKISLLQDLSGILSIERHAWLPEFFQLVHPVGFDELPLRRFGSSNDGGYVLPADIAESINGVVSIGIGDNNDVDFELASAGLKVHAWDHTVWRLPRSHSNITFHRNGVGVPNFDPLLMSLETLVHRSFPTDTESLLLLIDVEGAEWEAIDSAPDSVLLQFSTIAVEFHDLGNMFLSPFPQMDVLRRLNQHFIPIVVHPNNYGATWEIGEYTFPDILEVVYINRTLMTGVTPSTVSGNGLTRPCCPDLKEHPFP